MKNAISAWGVCLFIDAAFWYINRNQCSTSNSAWFRIELLFLFDMRWYSECTYNDLLIRRDELQSFLNDPAAVHLQGQRQHVTSDPLRKSQLLVQAAKLKHANIKKKNKPVNPLIHLIIHETIAPMLRIHAAIKRMKTRRSFGESLTEIFPMNLSSVTQIRLCTLWR